MPAGKWEKCGATKPKPGGKYVCQKKAGHTETGSPDNRKHADTKTAPAMYWKDNGGTVS
jgi:hypothetical protein